MGDHSRNRFRYIFYVLAGLYLLHTAYSIFKGMPDVTGNEKIIALISMAVFVVAAVVLIAVGVKRSLPGSRQDGDDQEEDVNENEEG